MHLHPPSGSRLGGLKAVGLPRHSLAAIGLFVLANLVFTAANAEPRAGQLLASQCAQCHGTNGSGYESIAGKSASSLYGDLIKDDGIGSRRAYYYPEDAQEIVRLLEAQRPAAPAGGSRSNADAVKTVPPGSIKNKRRSGTERSSEAVLSVRTRKPRPSIRDPGGNM